MRSRTKLADIQSKEFAEEITGDGVSHPDWLVYFLLGFVYHIEVSGVDKMLASITLFIKRWANNR